MSELDQETRRIGADEWVAQVEERREAGRGPRALLVRTWSRMPPAARLALFVVPAAVFPLLVNSGDVYRYGIITLLYALLALGLNTVVGFAGLLDLGYMAFFGFGAYAFGFLASDHSGHHVRPEVAIPLVVVMTAMLGLLLGLPSRRLIGDYLAIVTLFFGQAFVVFVMSWNEPVAHAVDGLNVRRVSRVRLQLRAQTGDVVVDGSRHGIRIEAPHLVQDLVSRHHAVLP